MTLLSRVDDAAERMDRPDVDREHLADALGHVAAVNRWLGATRALLRHLPDALPDALPDDPRDQQRAAAVARVLDVGTGSGDLPLSVAGWARERGRPLELTAVDIHEATLEVAAERTGAEPTIRLVRGDGLRLPFPTGTFDLALLSMTLHHMNGSMVVEALREAARVARGGRVVVGELERCLPNYVGARLLAGTLWRRNPVTRHDGPLSVLRAFTPAEMVEAAGAAGLARPRVHRHLFYRLVLVADA